MIRFDSLTYRHTTILCQVLNQVQFATLTNAKFKYYFLLFTYVTLCRTWAIVLKNVSKKVLNSIT